MTERPILFSAPMVRAILAGTKTQTRRVVKPQPTHFNPVGIPRLARPEGPNAVITCPYGQPGDRLWVRETFFCNDAFYPDGVDENCRWREVDGKRVAIPLEEQRAEMLEEMYYRADGEPDFYGAEGPTPWRPSIHMPRWASRISLEITSVRVERLQAISDADLECEGLQETIDAGIDHDGYPRDAWRALWSSINGADSWAADPWVWVVEFRRVQSPAVGADDGMLQPLIYAAIMHHGTPKTVAEFERAATTVADMLARRPARNQDERDAARYRALRDWKFSFSPHPPRES